MLAALAWANTAPAAFAQTPPTGTPVTGSTTTTVVSTPSAPRVDARRDLAFAAPDGASLQLDAYLPDTSGKKRPTIVIVHGGGWTTGDKSQAEPTARDFAAAGFVVFAVNYRLGPAGRFPNSRDDVRSAVRWIQDHASDFRVDRGRIGLLGESAGGNLAALVGADSVAGTSRQHPPLLAVASWSGVLDLSALVLAPLRSSTPIGCEDDPVCIGLIDPTALIGYVGCQIQKCPTTWDAASPVAVVTERTPPMYLAHSETEFVPKSQAEEMGDALDRLGVPAVVEIFPGNVHVPIEAATPPTIAFFKRALAKNVRVRPRTRYQIARDHSLWGWRFAFGFAATSVLLLGVSIVLGVKLRRERRSDG